MQNQKVFESSLSRLGHGTIVTVYIVLFLQYRKYQEHLKRIKSGDIYFFVFHVTICGNKF